MSDDSALKLGIIISVSETSTLNDELDRVVVDHLLTHALVGNIDYNKLKDVTTNTVKVTLKKCAVDSYGVNVWGLSEELRSKLGAKGK